MAAAIGLSFAAVVGKVVAMAGEVVVSAVAIVNEGLEIVAAVEQGGSL